jgi:cytochrome oxidase Cu insertion factor (SCO1/SenC/PrrC family)
MSKQKRATRTPKIGQIAVVALIVGVVIVGGLFISQRSSSGTAELPDTDVAFSVLMRVGEPAPAFTAIAVDGQPYTFTPGDGRPKTLVFYMGFG